MNTLNTLCCMFACKDSQVTRQGNHWQQKLALKRTVTHWQDEKRADWVECIQADAEWPSVEVCLLFTLICQWNHLTHPSASPNLCLSITRTHKHTLCLSVSLISPPLFCKVQRRKAHSWSHQLWLTCSHTHDMLQIHKATVHMQWTFPWAVSKQPHASKVRFTVLLCVFCLIFH